MNTTTLLLLALPPLLALTQDRITGRAFATRSEVIARNGMAATSQPLATQVALEILRHRPVSDVTPYAQQLCSHKEPRVSSAAKTLLELAERSRQDPGPG